MYRLLTASLLAVASLAAADGILSVNTWSDEGCTGNVDTVYLTGDNINPGSPSETYCFQNTPGSSLSDFQVADGWCQTTIDAGTYGDFVLTIWSGDNCEGSSQDYGSTFDGCVDIPYASVSLGCTNYY